MSRRFSWRCLYAICALAAPTSIEAGNSLLSLNRTGDLLLAANADNGSITVVDVQARKKLREVPVGKQPESVAWIGSGPLAIAAAYADDHAVIFNAGDGTVLARIKTPIEPYGVVVDSDGKFAYVTCEYPSVVVEIDLQRQSISREIPVEGGFVRGIVLTVDESRILVTHFHSGVVSAVDRRSGKVVDRWTGQSSDNLCRQIAVHPSLPLAYVPHIQSRIERAHGAGSIFPYVGVIDLADPPYSKGRRHTIAMDEYFYTLVTCNPWEIVVSPDGKKHFTIFAGTNDMFISEVVDDNYQYLRSSSPTFALGNNPRAAAISPDGNTLYVYNTLDFAVGFYDVRSKPPKVIGAVKVCDPPYSEEVLRGKILFNLGKQPMTRIKWIACSSCHPDGDSDGRTWQNPEGLRRTTHFLGMARTYPLHWSADRDELQDFEHTIRGLLMQGRGLLEGKLPPELGEPIAGRSKDLDALAAYCNRFDHPRISPHAAGPGKLTSQAERGREIFLSEQTACSKCHSGPDYTDRQTHDVGTGDDDPSEKMGPKYDTPTLLRAYRNLGFLHHGKAKSLRDVLTTQNKNDRHGKTSHLSPQEIDDLVEFLKSLPYDLPAKK